ncbi:Tautomerase/MIF [Penicillium longicatenatum]|uniref:Tautomerase/MIF n=1 Tax=Penicillium longicatenatum TaxID=1561947 RepID=UPI002548835E|nr:Tautomerase/MIF [Penicillium longicatenatum]KAJ5631070.1 Tautomerase/MIF [Penicillium longicatenatum]
MPLVSIHIVKGARTPSEVQDLSNVIHRSLQAAFKTPAKDRLQIITQHEDYELILDDNGLGFQRTKNRVLILITQQGRTSIDKQELFATLAEDLSKSCGLNNTDLMVSITTNSKEDWSFGQGKAQFLTGDL